MCTTGIGSSIAESNKNQQDQNTYIVAMVRSYYAKSLRVSRYIYNII